METLSRDRRGRYMRTWDTARRDALAVRLRSEGCSFTQIARAVGYANRSVACRAVQRALEAVVQPDVEALRELELDRLDAIHRRLWNAIMSGDTDAPMKKEEVVLLLRVMEQRARLLGLYPVPTRGRPT